MGDEDVEVSHQSGCSRMLNSIICALCVSPVVTLGMVVMLGWNERRSVCGMRALFEGRDKAQEVGCDSASAGNGKLVIFNCDLKTEGLTPFTFPGSDFSFSNYIGPGISVNAEMLQCVENSRTETKKDSVGGGTTSVTLYSYTVEWKSSRVDSSNFKGKGNMGSPFWNVCGGDNPPWHSGMPDSRSQSVASMKAGAFTIENGMPGALPLTKPLQASNSPAGWSYDAGSIQYTRPPSGGTQKNGIGSARVKFMGFDWSLPKVTVVGENRGGTIQSWTASDSWLCTGFTVMKLKQGSVDKDAFFDAMESENSAVTYVLRVVGFIVIWCAFKSIAGPLAVAADCIPCIGPCLGDSIEAIACCVTCPPACACALGVIGMVWVAMRPVVGIPLMLFFCCTMGSYTVYLMKKKMGGSGGGDGKGGETIGNEDA